MRSAHRVVSSTVAAAPDHRLPSTLPLSSSFFFLSKFVSESAIPPPTGVLRFGLCPSPRSALFATVVQRPSVVSRPTWVLWPKCFPDSLCLCVCLCCVIALCPGNIKKDPWIWSNLSSYRSKSRELVVR